jgi:FixJ family two-component response regulator
MSLAHMRARARYSRLADEVTDRVCEMLDHLAHKEDVRRHVDTVFRALADVRQGTQVYVPSVDAHARVSEILDAIADGATPRQVCRRFGISRRTYYRYRAILGRNMSYTACTEVGSAPSAPRDGGP